MIDKFKALIDRYSHITVVTHINPDPDTIATGLGVYETLKNYGKKVEIVNISKNIPTNLDFLKNYSKIKSKIDYDKSLIISCDCGDYDRLGFELKDREIINIDHHFSNTNYGILNIIDGTAVSASQVAYQFLKDEFKITKDIAECFYVALLSDTKNFTTNNIDKKTFEIASELISYNLNPAKITQNLNQRASLASLRVTALALKSLTLHLGARVSSMVVSKEDMLVTGAMATDLSHLSGYTVSLSTVEIGILISEINNKSKVSLRSKNIDVSSIANSFGGGGHKNASGFSVDYRDSKILLDEIIYKIENILDKG